jgi:phosphoenolpyruvate carboxykinase (ATP)
MKQHQTRVWLVNTGWTAGPYGVGQRIKLANTRAILDAIHAGSLAGAAKQRDPRFGFEVVTTCPGVPAEILSPRGTWKDPAAYDAAAQKLAGLFQANFKQYESGASAEIKAAGPVS